MDKHPELPKIYNCNCSFDDGATYVIQTESRNATAIKNCIREGGSLLGPGCQTPNYVPNVFYFSCLLFIFTYVISVSLKKFKLAPFFPTKVRQVVSDFAVLIAIVSMTLVDYNVGLVTPKLYVPKEFKVSALMVNLNLTESHSFLFSQLVTIVIGLFPSSTRRIQCGLFL